MRRLLLCVLAICGLPSLASAQLFYVGNDNESWLSGNAWFGQGGAGIVNWIPGYTANFNENNSIVNVPGGANISVGGINAYAGHTQIVGGGSLQMGSSSVINVNPGHSLSIHTPISATTLIKDREGSLNLYAGNSFTDFQMWGGGSVASFHPNAFGTNELTFRGGRAVLIHSGTMTNTVRLSSYGASVFTYGGYNPVWSGNITNLNANGVYFYLDSDYSLGAHNFQFANNTINFGNNGLFIINSNVHSNQDADAARTTMTNVNYSSTFILALGRGSLHVNNSTVNTGAIHSSSDWARLVINSGTVTAPGGVHLNANGVIASHLDLNGGVLATSLVRVSQYLGHTGFYFNGGTLWATGHGDVIQVSVNGTGSIYSGEVRIRNGGGTTDTNGFNVSLQLPVVDAPGESGGLVKNGAGTLTLTRTNGYTGGTVLNQGTILIESAIGGTGESGTLGRQNIFGFSPVAINNGATLDFSGKLISVGQLNTPASGMNGTMQGGEIYLRGTTYLRNGTIDAIIGRADDPIYVTNSGSESVRFTRFNSYKGTTVIAGKLIVPGLSNYNSPGGLGTRPNDNDITDIGILFRGGTLRYEGDVPTSTNRAIRLSNAGGTLDASGTNPNAAMYFVNSANPNFFENAGSRTLTLTGTNTGANTFATPINEYLNLTTTNIVKSGPGHWVLSGNNAGMNGYVAVDAGTMTVTNANALGTGGVTITTCTFIASGAALNIDGSLALSEHMRVVGIGPSFGNGTFNGAIAAVSGSPSLNTPISLLDDGSHVVGIRAANFTTLTVNAALYVDAGVTAGLAKLGNGTLILNAANSYTTTAINAGVLQVGTGGTTGTLGTGTATLAGGSLRFYRSDFYNIPDAIAGTGTVVLDGTTSATNPQTSTYQFFGPVTLGGTSVIQIGGPNGDARLARFAGSQVGAASILVTDGSGLFMSGLTSANPVTLNGLGWNEAAGYLGALRLAAGAVQSGPVTLATTSRIATYNSATGTIGGAVGGPGGLDKYGTGTLTLAGNNSYAGPTTVTQGTLRVTGNSAAATGAVTVGNGATLDGSGTVGGHATVAGGATLRGGTGPVGTLTLANGLDVASGGKIAVKIAGGSPAAPGTGGSTAGAPDPTTNSFLRITGGTTTIDAGSLFEVDLTGVILHHQPYSYRIASGAGDQSGLNIPSNQIAFVGSAVDPGATITGDSLGAVYLNFTPVPEPSAALSLLLLIVLAKRAWRLACPGAQRRV